MLNPFYANLNLNSNHAYLVQISLRSPRLCGLNFCQSHKYSENFLPLLLLQIAQFDNTVNLFAEKFADFHTFRCIDRATFAFW